MHPVEVVGFWIGVVLVVGLVIFTVVGIVESIRGKTEM